MTDFLSKYTGAQIDLMVSSGSSVSTKIIDNSLVSGSVTSTGSFGKVEATKLSGDGSGLTGIIGSAGIVSQSVQFGTDISGSFSAGTIKNRLPANTFSSSLQTFSAITASAPGTITAAGNISSSKKIIAKTIEVQGYLNQNGHITASGDISSSLASTGSFGSMILTNLPTVQPTVTGSLWLSGSDSLGKSKFLVVFNG